MDTQNGDRSLEDPIRKIDDQLAMLEGFLIGLQISGTRNLEPGITMVQNIRGEICETTG